MGRSETVDKVNTACRAPLELGEAKDSLRCPDPLVCRWRGLEALAMFPRLPVLRRSMALAAGAGMLLAAAPALAQEMPLPARARLGTPVLAQPAATADAKPAI